MTLFNITTSIEAPSSDTIWELGLQLMNLGGHKHSVHNIPPLALPNSCPSLIQNTFILSQQSQKSSLGPEPTFKSEIQSPIYVSSESDMGRIQSTVHLEAKFLSSWKPICLPTDTLKVPHL